MKFFQNVNIHNRKFKIINKFSSKTKIEKNFLNYQDFLILFIMIWSIILLIIINEKL